MRIGYVCKTTCVREFMQFNCVISTEIVVYYSYFDTVTKLIFEVLRAVDDNYVKEFI
jgi:hypothetical protein